MLCMFYGNKQSNQSTDNSLLSWLLGTETDKDTDFSKREQDDEDPERLALGVNKECEPLHHQNPNPKHPRADTDKQWQHSDANNHQPGDVWRTDFQEKDRLESSYQV